MRQTGSTAEILPLDVSDRLALEAAIAAAAQRLGGIDVLIACAAALVYGPFSELSRQDFDRLSRRDVPGCREHRAGRTAGARALAGRGRGGRPVASKVPIPLHSAYVAAKHAVRGVLDSLRVELRHRGSPVRVSMGHPA